jgi:hypothetical protein
MYVGQSALIASVTLRHYYMLTRRRRTDNPAALLPANSLMYPPRIMYQTKPLGVSIKNI